MFTRRSRPYSDEINQSSHSCHDDSNDEEKNRYGIDPRNHLSQVEENEDDKASDHNPFGRIGSGCNCHAVPAHV
jgi:hypothetical protein